MTVVMLAGMAEMADMARWKSREKSMLEVENESSPLRPSVVDDGRSAGAKAMECRG